MLRHRRIAATYSAIPGRPAISPNALKVDQPNPEHRQDYNHRRPHSALGYQIPAASVSAWEGTEILVEGAVLLDQKDDVLNFVNALTVGWQSGGAHGKQT